MCNVSSPAHSGRPISGDFMGIQVSSTYRDVLGILGGIGVSRVAIDRNCLFKNQVMCKCITEFSLSCESHKVDHQN